jgi:hypothetical protein
MAPPRTKPAPGARQRASGNVFAGATDKSQHSTHRRHIQQPGEICCYSGRDLDGWLQPRNGRWLAFDGDCRLIGSFASDRIAASAIYKAARPGRAP